MTPPEFIDAGLEHLRVIADRNYPIAMIVLEADGTNRHSFHSVIDPLGRQLTRDEFDFFGVQNSVFVVQDDEGTTVVKTTTTSEGLQAHITYNREEHAATVFLAKYPDQIFLVTETLVRNAETGARVVDAKEGIIRAQVDSLAQDAEINLSHELLSQSVILYEAPSFSSDTNKNNIEE